MLAMPPSPRHRNFIRIALVLSSLVVFGANAAQEKLPIHVPTDGAKWFGNDGDWSTITLRLGDPAQIVYLLAGTSASITTTVGAAWCNDARSGYNCDVRGRSFIPAESTTWRNIGQFVLGIRSELDDDNLQYTSKDYGFGDFGRDSIKIGNDEGRDLKMVDQTIAVVNDTTRLVGMLGLGLKSRTFVAEEEYPSFLSQLFDTKTIPSRSWGYTAGNYGRPRRTPMDLVLGGKNTGRYTANNVTFPLDANQNPVASLKTITVSATGTPPWGPDAQTLMFGPASVLIDSTTPFLWLPEGACRQFELALGLVWNETTSLYLMNDTNIHEGLVRVNMAFTFTLAVAPGSDQVVKIEVPYKALDLEISWPYVNTTENLRYFPLKRSTNEQQYTLGRAFLQEAYMIVDFDRGYFSVHQALFPPNNDEIVAIMHPDDEPHPIKKKKSGLSTAALAGIAVGAAAVVVASLTVAWFCYRRRKKMVAECATPLEKGGIWEAYGESAAVKPGGGGVVHVPPTQEMPAGEVERCELAAVNLDPAELSGSPTERRRFSWEEVDSSPVSPVAHHNNDPLLLQYQLLPQQPQQYGAQLSPMLVSPMRSPSRSVSDFTNPSPSTTDSRPHSNMFNPVSPETSKQPFT